MHFIHNQITTIINQLSMMQYQIYLFSKYLKIPKFNENFTISNNDFVIKRLKW